MWNHHTCGVWHLCMKNIWRNNLQLHLHHNLNRTCHQRRRGDCTIYLPSGSWDHRSVPAGSAVEPVRDRKRVCSTLESDFVNNSNVYRICLYKCKIVFFLGGKTWTCAQPLSSFPGWNKIWHHPGTEQTESFEWSPIWFYLQDQWRSDIPVPEDTIMQFS